MVVANRDENSQVSSGGPKPDYEFHELELLEKQPKDTPLGGSCILEVEAENLEDNDVATVPQELHRPLLDNERKDTSPAAIVAIDSKNPQDKVATVPSRQGCNERENHEAKSRPGFRFKDKRIKFLLAALLLSLVVILVFGVGCGTTTLCRKAQPPLQDVEILNSSGPSLVKATPPMQVVKILNSSESSLDEPTPPMQVVKIYNCSGSVWLYGHNTIYKNGHLLNQTLADICELSVTEHVSLIITLPPKCPGQYSCEIEGQKMETYIIG